MEGSVSQILYLSLNFSFMIENEKHYAIFTEGLFAIIYVEIIKGSTAFHASTSRGAKSPDFSIDLSRSPDLLILIQNLPIFPTL